MTGDHHKISPPETFTHFLKTKPTPRIDSTMPCRSTGDLLEPFPTERRISTLLRKLPLRQRAQVPQSVFSSSSSSSSTSCGFSSSPIHAGRARRSSSLGSSTKRSFSMDMSESGGLDASGHSTSEASLSDYSSSRYNRISVASVAGDSDEFRGLQADLRRSRMVTGAGAKQVMGRYIESRSRSVEARRQRDGELNRIKIAPPLPAQQRRFSGDLADRICDAFKQPPSSSTPADASRKEDHLSTRGLGARGGSRSFGRLEHCRGSTDVHTRSFGLKGGSAMFNLQAWKEDSIHLKKQPWIVARPSFDIKGFKSESFRSKRHDMIASGML